MEAFGITWFSIYVKLKPMISRYGILQLNFTLNVANNLQHDPANRRQQQVDETTLG